MHSAKDCNFSDQSSKKQKKDHVKQVNVIFHDPAMKQAGDAVCIYKNSTNDNHSAMQVDVEESTKSVLSQADERTPSIQDYKDLHNRLEQLLKDYDQLADIAHHTMEERDKSISDYDLLSKQFTSLQKSFDTYTKITEDANQQSNEVTNKLRTTLDFIQYFTKKEGLKSDKIGKIRKALSSQSVKFGFSKSIAY